MTDEQKIKLADIIINFLSENTMSSDHPRLVGTLNKRQGIKGFKTAEIGTPVFEYKDRYIIYMTERKTHSSLWRKTIIVHFVI